MSGGTRPVNGGLLALAIVLILLVYHETFTSIVSKWMNDSSYSHGLLIVPISIWLYWRERRSLLATSWRLDWLGAGSLALLGATWLMARATGVLVVEQFSALAMIPAAILAFLGRGASRTVVFASMFLMLAVPAGKGIVPWLMQSTADIAVFALRLTGVPIVRDGMMLSIPGGDFEVARACSGLNYLITGIALGALYAYLTYRTLSKRILFLVAAIAVPVLLNGVRAYLIVLVAHLTDMRWGTGREHVMFGRLLFLAAMALLFWAGRRWRDAQEDRSGRAEGISVAQRRRSWLYGASAAAASFLAIAAPPPYFGLAAANAHSRTLRDGVRIDMPVPSAGWDGPLEQGPSWRPEYHGAIAERAESFRFQRGDQVDIYVAAYGLGMNGDDEMVSYRNRLSVREQASLLSHEDVEVDLGGRSLSVREYVVPQGPGARLVWRWYMVGSRRLRSEVQVKAAEGLAYLKGGDASSRVLLLSSVVDHDLKTTRERLRQFASAHADCVLAGFEPAGCVN